MEGNHRILLACRGVEARRLQRSAADLGLEVAALVGDDDDEASWAEGFDYTMFLLNPWPTASEVVGLALDAGCDLIHPGWGALARQGELMGRSQMVGLTTVGPHPAHLQLVADGSQIRDLAAELDIPVVPGSAPCEELADIEAWLAVVGFPAMVRLTADLDGAWIPIPEDAAARQETLAALLSQGSVVLERAVETAREIEVLVAGQSSGEALTLGERETSIRVDGQRAVVESPVVDLNEEQAFHFRQAAAMLVSRLRWPGLVSVRFLLTPDGRAYLLRLRPGLQPWHAVTEEILGIDLVDAQLRIAMDEELGWEPYHFDEKGHSFCLRLFAIGTEPGPLTTLKLPEDVRLLRGFEQGDVIRPGEEIAQIVVHAPTRHAAFVRARVALENVEIDGMDSNLPMLKSLFERKDLWDAPQSRDRFQI